MDPITDQTLAANAFRTLGLSGAAGQSSIEAAARKMRIWPDPSHVPPTAWDLPWLGPIARSRVQIEQAVALLRQPRTRLEQRLLWFGTEQPPVGPDETLAADSPAGRHARALGSLHRAWGAGPDWGRVLAEVAGVCREPATAQWIEQIESRGGFDSPASIAEIEATLAGLPASVAAGFVDPAIAELKAGRFDTASVLASAVGKGEPIGIAPAGQMLFDRAEDIFFQRAEEMASHLRQTLRHSPTTPGRLFQDNYDYSKTASEMYRDRIAPIARWLIGESGNDRDRSMRVRGRCGEVLVLLALGWECSDRWIAAEIQLQQAKLLARGTVAELDIDHALQRVSPEADRKRAAQRRPVPSAKCFDWGVVSPPKPPRTDSGSGALRPLLFVLILAVVAIGTITQNIPTPDSSAPLPAGDLERSKQLIHEDFQKLTPADQAEVRKDIENTLGHPLATSQP